MDCRDQTMPRMSFQEDIRIGSSLKPVCSLAGPLSPLATVMGHPAFSWGAKLRGFHLNIWDGDTRWQAAFPNCTATLGLSWGPLVALMCIWHMKHIALCMPNILDTSGGYIMCSFLLWNVRAAQVAHTGNTHRWGTACDDCPQLPVLAQWHCYL